MNEPGGQGQLHLEAFCLFKKDDTQLLLRNYGERGPEDLIILFEMGLDYFDEQLETNLKNASFDGNLGLLCKKDASFLYGRALPNGLKIIIVLQSAAGAQPNPNQLNGAFEMVIKMYIKQINNPFYSIGTPFSMSEEDPNCPISAFPSVK
jgi:hypothetical protein